jgi:Transglutaminase-like superfamily
MSRRQRLRLLVRSAAWAAVLPSLKLLFPAPRLARLMWRDPRSAGRDPALEDEVVAVVERVYAHGRIPRRHNCLERSLLAYRYLSEINAAPVLVVGLANERTAHGHAWVLVDGEPIAEPEHVLAEMTPILSFGRRGTVL